MSSLIASFFVVWRETFEAFLVIFLLWTALSRSSQWLTAKPYVVAGTAVGVVLSCVFAYFVFEFSEQAEGKFAIFLRCVAPIIAAGLMLHMVTWMSKHSRALSGEIKTLANSGRYWSVTWGVFLLIGYTLSREGFETVVYLYGMSLNPVNAHLAWYHYIALLIAGSGASILSMVALKKGLGFFNLKTFFRLTNLFLLGTAASLLVIGINRLIEAELLNPLIDSVWDTSRFLSTESVLGKALNLLLGYTPQPSLTLLIAYALFWILAVVLMLPKVSFAVSHAPKSEGATQPQQSLG